MSKHKLRIRREKRNKLHKMKQGNTEREKEMKNYGTDFYYEYSKKLLGTVSGAGEVRLISSMYAPNHCHYLKVHLVWYKL